MQVRKYAKNIGDPHRRALVWHRRDGIGIVRVRAGTDIETIGG